MIADFGKFNQHFVAGSNNRGTGVSREGARSSGHISSTFGNSREQRTTPTGATKVVGEYRRVAYNPHMHQNTNSSSGNGTGGNQGHHLGASNPSLKNSYTHVNSSQSHKSTRDTHASQSSANNPHVNAFKDNHVPATSTNKADGGDGSH